MSYIVYTQLIDATGVAFGTEANPLVFRSARAGLGILSLSEAANSIGDHILIPAVPGKQIKVLALSVFSPGGPGATTATFTDDPGGAALFTVLAQAPADFVFTFEAAANLPAFLFATSPGKALNLNLNLANQVLANLTYWVDG